MATPHRFSRKAVRPEQPTLIQRAFESGGSGWACPDGSPRPGNFAGIDTKGVTTLTRKSGRQESSGVACSQPADIGSGHPVPEALMTDTAIGSYSPPRAETQAQA